MVTASSGIHHITAMAGDPQKNIDFYVKVLGLRLVKKTVNFDDPYTYHFYFGDESGNPGTIMTFFPWTSRGLRGRKGLGQVTTTSFSVPEHSLKFWQKRLESLNIGVAGPFGRFDEQVLTFEDPDGLDIELIAATNDTRSGWENGDVPAEHAIRGFHSATAAIGNITPTKQMLTEIMGFREMGTADGRIRLATGNGQPGALMDLISPANALPGSMGVGVVHHIAWRAADASQQREMRGQLLHDGQNVTPVLDRNYFQSIYFREPGGVLFEIATDPPGFAIDETPENLGESLKLPDWLETRREEIESHLPKIKTK